MHHDVVIFQDENHQYLYKGEVYQSVSSVIGSYKPPFRSDYWSSIKAIQKLITKEEWKKLVSEWCEMGFKTSDDEFIDFCLPSVDIPEFFAAKMELLADWKNTNLKSIRKGNHYHLSQEERSYDSGKELNPFDLKLYDTADRLELPEGVDNMARCENLIDLDTGFYPELLIFNHEFKIAGQSDKVFVDAKRKWKYVDVDDYKTNKKIRKSRYNRETGGPYKMLPPVDHLNDANHTHYELQMSLYAWMLEQFGFKIRNLAFHHFNQKYPLKYRKREVEAILEDYRS